jgi:hypothetical protein
MVRMVQVTSDLLGVFPSIPLKAGNAQEAFSDGRDCRTIGMQHQ